MKLAPRSLSLCLLLLISAVLQGCASSDVSRNAAMSVDSAYKRSDLLSSGAGDASPVNSYKNSSEIAQGATEGGLAGAVIGGATSGTIGILPGAVGGAVVGGVLGALVEHHSNIIDQIENRGGQVFVLGDQIMIVLPSVQIFRGISPSIRPQAYPTLDLVAQMIRGYATISVKVAAYTYGDGTPEIDLSVSQQQADNVVKYLGSRADTRLIHAVGYGGAHLIDKIGAEANYRLEITFEKLPV